MAAEASSRLKKLAPILAVPNVLAAVRYYERTLGFEKEWLWQDPPTHGAVSRDGLQIQFTLNAELAARAKGTSYFIFVDGVDALHGMHVERGAAIVEPIGNRPWGLREYTVRDLNGYDLRFAGPPNYVKPAGALQSMPTNIRIEQRRATPAEYLALTASVGWDRNVDAVPVALANSIYCIVAIDEKIAAEAKHRAGEATAEDQAVGMLRLVGDRARAVYFQDVIVRPSYQGQRIGAAMMEAAMAWLRANAPSGAFIGLFTMRHSFYEQFGFQNDPGMHLRL
jgi:GNAT superfamily N-acetyltransferase/uncharacterized glyoxalase superfamily protein PhnB